MKTKEIKFRLYNHETGVMTKFNDISTHTASYALASQGAARLFTIMSFTGHHDENGNEVCEHDVIMHHNELFVVFWSNDYFMWQAKHIHQHHDMGYPLNEFYGCEVVGNVYQGFKCGEHNCRMIYHVVRDND